MKKLKLQRITRYFGYILLVAGLFSCSETKPKNDPNCRQWILEYTNNNDWGRQAIICDSLEMINLNEAVFWIKGKKSKLFAQKIYPMFQPCN
jgi:hypothetical protein